MIENIERTVLSSVLEGGFYGADEEIINFKLNPEYFTNKYHKMIAKGINRLMEQNKPIDGDVLYYEFKKGYKKQGKIVMPPALEEAILSVIATMPMTTYSAFLRYYKILEERHQEKIKRMAVLL